MAKITKASEIQKAISDDIVHGRRAPGAALDETVLAREFAVSRTPIREAIRQLEMSGLVEGRPHRGAIVCSASPERLDEMSAVLRELEAFCARLAAGAMAPEARAALRVSHDASRDLVVREDGQAYATHDERFHEAIFDGTGNGFLAQTTRHVRLRVAPFRRAQFEERGRLARSFEEHARVVAAIERSDAAAAEAAMRALVGGAREAAGETGPGNASEAEVPRPRRPRPAKGRP